MTVSQEPPLQWQPRERIRSKTCQSSPNLRRHYSLQYPRVVSDSSADAATLGPRKIETGLVVHDLTRTLRIFHAPSAGTQHSHRKSLCLLPPTAAFHNTSTIGLAKGDCFQTQTANLDPGNSAATAANRKSAIITAADPAALPLLSAPTHGIAIRHEYVLEMSKKSKRQSKSMRLSVGGAGGGRMDIMDSLVSSIDDIEAKQMRGLPVGNGHHRRTSDEFPSIISVSPAPVIQTSKSSTRSPSSQNKLTRRSSVRNSANGVNGRHDLRVSPSQEWLPPMEVDEDFYNVRHSYSSTNSTRHLPQIPARSTSITHEIHPPPQIPQRSNSLLHVNSIPAPLSASRHSSKPGRSQTKTEIPSYITRYLQTRGDSSENLSVEQPPLSPISPRRSNHISRAHSPRLRNSTTTLPGNDQLRIKVVTKRQSSQGFERDLSATRHFYSLPSPNGAPPRRSASLQPSRSSMASDRISLSRVNNNYVDEVLSNPKLTQRIRLTTGRILSFSEVGDEKGWPVFCFTGMGLNRLVAAFYDEIASSFGLRIITPDRPGIGLSEEIRPSPKKVLAWADDITEICQALNITNFSLLGHSLGATYALAVALRLPEKIRGQVHLLAPWIPLSQVNAATALFDDIAMDSSCMSFPATHRFLRVLPVPIIKVAGNFLREKEYDGRSNGMTSPREVKRSNSIPHSRKQSITGTLNGDIHDENGVSPPATPLAENDLVAAIWAAATRDSNATVDLLTSLERPHTVGFTYFDVTLPVIIRHGSKDERVPLERVVWMTKAMNMARERNAELKVIQGAQHGLMARADVMSDVFEEIARESHAWDGCVRCRKGGGCWLASTLRDGPPVPGKEKSSKYRNAE